MPPALNGRVAYFVPCLLRLLVNNVDCRNQLLEATGMTMPKARKTGTTLAGVVFDGGVVLGADTRATGGDTVCDKNCDKIHYIADNI
eukprot:6200418-Pleurochrysis_carterae.AAC.1